MRDVVNFFKCSDLFVGIGIGSLVASLWLLTLASCVGII